MNSEHRVRPIYSAAGLISVCDRCLLPPRRPVAPPPRLPRLPRTCATSDRLRLSSLAGSHDKTVSLNDH